LRPVVQTDLHSGAADRPASLRGRSLGLLL
jgi:hypothetical protein